jgi:NAD(P)H-dependent FMN reductase
MVFSLPPNAELKRDAAQPLNFTLGCNEDTVKILAISGSARDSSTNTALLRAMRKLVPVNVELLVIHNLNTLPIFSPDTEGKKTPMVVCEFLESVSVADGIIISSPEYVRAIPGGLKNAIDWMVSRFEIIDKPISLVHASHRGDDMLASLRLVLSTVSSNFLEDLFFRVPLIGKSPQEITEFLGQPEHESTIASFLHNFVEELQMIGSTPLHSSGTRPEAGESLNFTLDV